MTLLVGGAFLVFGAIALGLGWNFLSFCELLRIVGDSPLGAMAVGRQWICSSGGVM
jgi:hypothetical protein